MTVALRPEPLTAQNFAPFGAVIERPGEPGERALHGRWFEEGPPGSGLQVHANHVPASALPLAVRRIERHPHAAQGFVPLDVAAFLCVVFPAGPDGAPLLGGARAFLAPGRLGVIYARNVWHLGATVLDRPGSFVVLMRRANDGADDVFAGIAEEVSIERP